MSRKEALSGLLALYSLDAFVKKYMKHHLKAGQPQKIAKGHIILERLDNKGAALGFLADKEHLVKAASTGVLCLMGTKLYMVSGQKDHTLETVGLTLLTAGGLGNVSDRLAQGYVDDYLRIPCKHEGISRVVFNLADVFVVSGAALSAVAGFFE